VRRETAEIKACRIIQEELARLGWIAEDLAKRRKNDPDKLSLAVRLRKETTLPVKQIAGLVSLGTSQSANVNLHQWMQSENQARNTIAAKIGI
jgi:hypothetical protein